MSGLPKGWAKVALGELLTNIETGKSFKCDERPPAVDEVGVVKVSAVTWGQYQEQESKTCLDPERVNPALFIRAGDFLFSRANTLDLVGACVLVASTTRRVMLSDKILRFQFASDAHKTWVLRLLRSKMGREQIEALASGNQESMRNIGQERIRQIDVPLPPDSERSRIDEKLDELLSDLDAGEAELKAKLAENPGDHDARSMLAALHAAMTARIEAAGPEAQLKLICDHPELAGKAAVRGELTQESTREQKGAGLDQCSVMRNRVMAMRQQKSVATFPRRIFGAQVHGMAVGHGQHIGPAQGLTDVALTLHFAHAQGVASDSVGALGQRILNRRWVHGVSSCKWQHRCMMGFTGLACDRMGDQSMRDEE